MMAKTSLAAPAPVEPFTIGDHVTWASQANGSTLVKTGTIVGIVPPETVLWRFLQRHDASLSCYDQTPIEKGSRGRIETSYLVAVSVQTRAGNILKRQRLYWPRTKALRLHEGAQ